MRDASRTLAASVPAGVVIALAWLRLEHPLASLWRTAALVALALAAAALPGWRLRVAGSVAAAVVAARLVFGVWLVPFHPAAGAGHVGARFDSGVLDFYATHLPFDPRVHVAMTELVFSAVFSFTLVVALVAAGRRPVAAALAFLAGAGWPATLLGPSHGLAMGAAILVAGLALLAALGSRRVPALAVPVAAVIVLGAVAAGSATAARHGALRWQAWNLANGGAPASVSFVWNAQYGGLHWPRRATVVLDVRSRTQPGYLRATVLDDFVGDRWTSGAPRPSDSLEPAAAFRPANQTREDVTVQGLSDIHLVGGTVPVRFTAGGAPIFTPEPGFAVLANGLASGFHYTVWSYSPHPSAARLARVPAVYPQRLLEDGMLGVGDGIEVPRFGVPHRAAQVVQSVSDTVGLYRYLPLLRVAEHVTRGARTPYVAVAELERWFLGGGGFRYSDHPRVVRPQPLIGFVLKTRSGYCQYFAGAMALMLRYLGIPARVAVGFAGPTWDSAARDWVVTDHDAHAWVEVWFRGYGWLPFDPTPAAPGSSRESLVAGFTRAGGSTKPLPNAGVLNRDATPTKQSNGKGLSSQHLGHAAGGGSAAPSGGSHIPVAFLVLLVLGAAGGGVVATKHGLRLARRVEREPRRVAAACREELAGFLLDQRIELSRSATVHELGELVRREFGVDTEPFVAALAAARYGPADRAGAAARTARRELASLIAACRRSLSRRERLLGLLSLRSLTRPRPPVGRSASLGSTGS